jgi:oxygen-independent coproporphyrinogen-3 oxidase
MDHFALPSDDLAKAQQAGCLRRNFMGYTTHADCDLIGLGVSAISHIGESFSQNSRDLPGWESALEADRLPVWRGLELDFDDVLRADIIQDLMCQGKIDIAAIEKRYEIAFRQYFADAWPALSQLESEELITMEEHRIATTSRGRYLLRVVAMCFDRYFQNPTRVDHAARYSNAI